MEKIEKVQSNGIFFNFQDQFENDYSNMICFLKHHLNFLIATTALNLDWKTKFRKIFCAK